MAKELADIVLEMEKSSQSIKEMEYDSQETKIVRIRKDNGMITVYNSEEGRHK